MHIPKHHVESTEIVGVTGGKAVTNGVLAAKNLDPVD